MTGLFMLGMLVGGAIFFAGFVVGATHRKPKERDVGICLCKHGVNRHDKDGCHAVFITRNTFQHIIDTQECTCLRYMGPESPMYAPELEET